MLMILCKHGCDDDDGKYADYDCDDTALINSMGALPSRQTGVSIPSFEGRNLPLIINNA